MTTSHGRQFLFGLMLSLLAMGTAHAASITRTSSFEYDPVSGRLAKTIVEPDDAQLRLETTVTYDAWGNKKTVTVSSPVTGSAAITPRVTRTDYDTRGQFPIANWNALNHKEEVVVDPKFGVQSNLKGPNALTTMWTYDAFGRKTWETRADNTQTRIDYLYCAGYNSGTTVCPSSARYIVQSTPYMKNGSSPVGAWTKIYYDALDREVRSETQGFDGIKVIVKDTVYDNLGRVSNVSVPYYSGEAQQWVTYFYDPLGRVIKERRRDNSETTTDYNGLTTVMTNALTQKRTQTKNSQGQVIQVIDADSNSITYKYDPLGNLTQTIDPWGNATTLTYDIRGRKKSMIDRDMGTWTYEYNVASELLKQTDAKNQITNMLYDALGRMYYRAEPNLVSNWTYDSCAQGVGKLCSSTADNGYVSTLSYDGYGRPSGTSTTIDASYNTSIGYDGNGRPATQTYPTGLTVKYVYSTLGYLYEVRNNATNALYWRAGSKDAEGQMLQQTYGNNVIAQHIYEYGRLKSSYAGPGNNVQNNSYSFDPVGNLLTRSDANQNLSETFHYDNLRRVRSSTVNSGGAGIVTQNYDYDILGNVKYRSDLGTYTYNPSGAGSVRPHAVKEITLVGGGKQQYTYDDNGNMSGLVVFDATGNVVAGKGRTDVYTSFNMPKTLSGPNTSLTFDYGPEHQRVKQIATVNGMTNTTIYLNPGNSDGLLYEKEIKVSGTEHKSYVTAGDRVIAIVTETPGITKVRYLHHDYLGSTSAITDEAGNVVERLAYEPFGKRRTPAGALDPNNTIAGVNTDRGFTMHEHLDGWGLIHMNGRVYDPAMGRFMSADPNVPHPLDMQSFNRYSYARNNPLVYVDPDGFYDDWCGDCGGDAGGTGYFDTPTSGASFGYQNANGAFNSTATLTSGGSGSYTNAGSSFDLYSSISATGAGDSYTSSYFDLEFGSANSNASSSSGRWKEATKDWSVDNWNKFWRATWEAEKAAFRNEKLSDGALKMIEGMPGGSGTINAFGRLSRLGSAAEKAAEACCCFPAGTPVLTENGATPIEQIRVGQMVYSRDPITGSKELKPVTSLMITEGKTLFELMTQSSDGKVQRLEVTDNHPIWVDENGWVESAKLKAGMVLRNYDDEKLMVMNLTPLHRTETTYNFSVADFHTYFAGKQQLFVHNECACASAARALIKPINLPGWNKVTVDMLHVAERHMSNGSRIEGKSVFVGLNERGVMAAIQQAYGSATKVQIQGERVLLEGITKTGMTVQMWLNKTTNVIETAYPVGGR